MTMDQQFQASGLVLQEEKLKELVEIVKYKISEKNNAFILPIRTDAAFLVKFIRCKKYDADRAVAAVEKYYDNVYSNLRILEGIRPRDFTTSFNMGVVRVLKQRINGSLVIVSTIGKWDTKMATLRQLQTAGSFFFEEMFQDMEIQLNGFIGIVDMSGLAFTHTRQITYHELKFLIKCCLEMFPMKVSGIHCLNTPMLFWPLYKLGMKVVPKKLQSRIHLHSNTESLIKTINPQYLPRSLGGILDDANAFDDEIFPKILHQNICYDSYWNGAFGALRSRRLSRKRSSIMMIS